MLIASQGVQQLKAVGMQVLVIIWSAGSQHMCEGSRDETNPKPSCNFQADDFRAVEVEMETAIVADTVIALYELPSK
jgi:hypothetical protein